MRGAGEWSRSVAAEELTALAAATPSRAAVLAIATMTASPFGSDAQSGAAQRSRARLRLFIGQDQLGKAFGDRFGVEAVGPATVHRGEYEPVRGIVEKREREGVLTDVAGKGIETHEPQMADRPSDELSERFVVGPKPVVGRIEDVEPRLHGLSDAGEVPGGSHATEFATCGGQRAYALREREGPRDRKYGHDQRNDGYDELYLHLSDPPRYTSKEYTTNTHTPRHGGSMDTTALHLLLAGVADGTISMQEAAERLADLPFSEVESGGSPVARVDHHRELRTGYPEVVFCQGKTPQQVKAIARNILGHGDVLLGTRASAAQYQSVAQVAPDARYFEDAQILLVDRRTERPSIGHIVVASAGTADIRVAEEAAICAEVMGDRVTRLFDIGVAGIHRLLSVRGELAEANVIIAVAGMEGALPSLIAGLVKVPVVAVPTSVGYGTHFGGIAPLLTMLNSCAPGIGVVNIDNGYGAAALASRINRAASAGTGETVAE